MQSQLIELNFKSLQKQTWSIFSEANIIGIVHPKIKKSYTHVIPNLFEPVLSLVEHKQKRFGLHLNESQWEPKLVTNIHQNIFFRVQQKKESH